LAQNLDAIDPVAQAGCYVAHDSARTKADLLDREAKAGVFAGRARHSSRYQGHHGRCGPDGFGKQLSCAQTTRRQLRIGHYRSIPQTEIHILYERVVASYLQNAHLEKGGER
jgi:hypothetical protein